MPKTQVGLILRVAREPDLDLGPSILVGDKISECEAGMVAKVRTCILVRTGHRLPKGQLAYPAISSLDELAVPV